MKRNRRQSLSFVGFLLPNLSGFLVFTAGPVLFSFVVAFSNWNLQATLPFRWIGITNFVKLAHDPTFWQCLVNTIYLLIGMPVSIAGSLFLAILLNQKLRGMVAYRTMFYIPSFTAGVALMILWKYLYNPDFGPINAAISAVSSFLHLQVDPPQWLLSTKNVFGLDIERLGVVASQWGLGAKDAIIIMGVWTGIGGGNMLLYLAALTNVPEELIEAGQLDGANKWQLFRHITWPQLAPTTFFIVIMSFIGGFQGGFEQARVMTGGGPAGTTKTIAYYIYSKAFDEFQIGYASAMSWMLFALIFATTMVNWKIGNRETSY